MINLISTAAKNFLNEQIELKSEENHESSETRTFIASIEIELDNGETQKVFLCYDDALLRAIVDVYLGETEPDEQTLVDMALESTNMIVGSAKMLSTTKDHFNIKTPIYEGDTRLEVTCSEEHTLFTDKDNLHIAIL